MQCMLPSKRAEASEYKAISIYPRLRNATARAIENKQTRLIFRGDEAISRSCLLSIEASQK